MNKYFLPIYHSQLKPWIKFWLLKRLKPSAPVTLKAVTISEGTLTKVDKSKALSIKEYYGNTVQDGTPTPDSPIPVQTISGDNTFTINSVNYRVDFGGKNLLDISNMQTGTKNGITITKNDTTGEITISGTATAYTPYNIPCNLSGNNTYSCDNWGSFILYFQYNGTGVSNATANKTYNGNVNNIVLAVSNGTTIDKTIKLQVEKGSVATEYSPYVSNPIELCKIGDYKDKIYNDNGTWKIEKKVGKVILNGSEDYNYESAGQRFTTVVQGSMLQNARNEIYSNYFVYSSSGGANGYAFNFGGVIYLYNYDYTSASGLKTWLTSHNSIFYYKLQNPTTETITNTNLISQLNALYEFYVGLSTVNIYNDSEITLEVLLEYYGR